MGLGETVIGVLGLGAEWLEWNCTMCKNTAICRVGKADA